jgi:uncharacterized protein YerC
MTRISNTPLTKNQEINLFNQFGVLFAKKTQTQVQDILNDLLGKEEKIMLAKRLAIIILLYRNQTTYFIAKNLNVSTATVHHVQEGIHSGKFNAILQTLKKPTSTTVAILESIDDILHLGGILPHYGQTHASEAYRKRAGNRTNLSFKRKV